MINDKISGFISPNHLASGNIIKDAGIKRSRESYKTLNLEKNLPHVIIAIVTKKINLFCIKRKSFVKILVIENIGVRFILF